VLVWDLGFSAWDFEGEGLKLSVCRNIRVSVLIFVIMAALAVVFCNTNIAFAGSIVGWGWNDYGQASPPSGDDFTAISTGVCHSLALRSDGSIDGWGSNYDEPGNWVGQAMPPAGNDYIAIAAGGYHSLALRSDGSIIGWGANYAGQANPPAGNDYIAIAAGGYHSLALRSDSSIVGWGHNRYGQASPLAGNNYVAIAAGWMHSLALRSDGSIVGWGSNDYGQASPPAGNSYVAIAAGYWHSLALKSDGSIVAWGDNRQWQCDVPSPNSDFIAITAGGVHNLGLKSDGSIVAWGRDWHGQCNIPSPNRDFIAIAAGYDHSLGLKAEQIRLTRFEINQCFQQTDGTSQRYDLIETKPFVARVTLEKAAGPRATIKVKLTVYDATTEEQIVPTKQQTATIRPQSPKTLEFIFNDNETRNIKAGDYRFSLVVEDNDATTLLDQNLTYQFKSSKTVRMLTIQILLYDWKLGFWNDRYIEFTEQVFPVPKTTVSDVNHIEIVPKWFLRSGHSRNRLVRDMQVCLQNYNSTNPSRRADFICAVVPDGVLPRNIVGWRLGSAVLIEAHQNSQYILGHETGHIYTLGEEYIDSEPQNADGLWVLDKTFRFDGNPPPLKLDPDGPFSIAAGRPDAGRRCDWADDITAYAIPSPYFDQQGNIRWWCTGRYVLEGGYDVAGKRQIATSTFSMMSAATGSAWISGPEYQTLINQLVTDQAKSAYAPIPLSAGQDRVLVSGIVDIPAKTAELSPLTFDPNLVPTAEVMDPNCRLVFISQLGATLGSFGFGPLEGELPESHLRGPFCVVVDLPQETARIQLTIDGTITAEVQVTDGIPTVTVLSPNGGEQITDQLVISWSASDPDNNDLSYTVEFSHDNGTEWSALVVEHEVNELIVDTNCLPGGPNCLVKVTASDGWNRAEDISDAPFSITTQPPKITILDPGDGAILLHSESMQGRCTAYDPETGDITEPNAIVWTSDVDGFVGKGNLIGFELSLGNHALSATATDPEGKSATDTVGVRVVANLADFNYDQRVNLLDLAKFADRWCATCSEPNWCEGADLDHSGVIDFADLAELSENWLWQQD